MSEHSPKHVAEALREIADQIEQSLYILGVQISVEHGHAERYDGFQVHRRPSGEDTFTITIRRQRKMPASDRTYCPETSFPPPQDCGR